MATKHQKDLELALVTLLPAVPFLDGQAILKLASLKKFKRLPISINIWLVTISYIRHTYTDYDRLLDEGYDRDSARFFVLNEINEVLTNWQAKRLLTFEDDENK